MDYTFLEWLKRKKMNGNAAGGTGSSNGVAIGNDSGNGQPPTPITQTNGNESETNGDDHKDDHPHRHIFGGWGPWRRIGTKKKKLCKYGKRKDGKCRKKPFQKHKGFIYSYHNSFGCEKDYINWHPGFAWAARKEAINALGGLVDFAILGAADRHMAHGLIGKMEKTIHKKLSSAYAQDLLRWEERAEKYIKGNVGYVDGLLLHYWHGKKRDRRYQERWNILVNSIQKLNYFKDNLNAKTKKT